ncbi:MAG TPA: hypothetical protein VF533_12165 [Solirubrobacteraceae bacterium]|jgi:hypothetical protein
MATSVERRMRRRTRVGLLAVGLAACTAAPAHGAADAIVAAGPDGGASFAWSQLGSPTLIQERSLTAAGALSETQFVSPATSGGALGEKIGTDSAGDAVIAWLGHDGSNWVVRARGRLATGGLTPLQRLSAPGYDANNLSLAVEPDGDAVVAWERYVGDYQVIEARRRAADGTLGPVHTLSYGAARSEYPDVAVAPDGTATVVWLRHAGGDKQYIQARTIAANGSLSATQTLTPTGLEAYTPSVSMDGAGRAVFGWTRTTSGGALIAETRARSAGGVLSAPQRLSATGSIAFELVSAGDATGRRVFAWLKRVGSVDSLAGRIRRADGTLSAEFPLGADDGINPAVAIDPNGNATFAWHTDEDVSVVHSRRRSVAGTLGTIRTLSNPAQNAAAPHVAVDPAGKATIAWYLPPSLYFAARTVTAGGTMSPIRLINGDS